MLLTMEEASRLMNVHYITIHDWIKNKGLPYKKVTEIKKDGRAHYIVRIDKDIMLKWYKNYSKNKGRGGKRRIILTDEQKRYIREHSRDTYIKYIASYLNISIEAVSRYIRENNLPTRKAKKGEAIRNSEGKYRKRYDRYYSIPPLIDDNKFYQNWRAIRLLYEMYFRKRKKGVENVY